MFWSSKLGISRRISDSDTGWKGEKNILDLLRNKGFHAERTSSKSAPFDILVDGIVRLDIKSANYAEYGNCRGWFYRLGKTPQSDLIVLHQLDTLDNYVLPWNHCPTSNMTISRDGGKYSQYINRWDILSEYVKNLDFIRIKD